jgi:hypothetical protein
MDILKEVDFSPRDASRMMNEFAEDTFLEEQDPDLAGLIKRVSASFAIGAFEIRSSPLPSEAAPDSSAIQEQASSRRHRRTKPPEEVLDSPL